MIHTKNNSGSAPPEVHLLIDVLLEFQYPLEPAIITTTLVND